MSLINPAIESEKTVLGALLLDNDLIPEVIKRLLPSDFSSVAHELIFANIIVIFNERAVVDCAMIVDFMDLDDAQAAYLYELATECFSTRNILSHVDIIREKSVKRRLLDPGFHEENPLEDNWEEKKDTMARYLEELATIIRKETTTKKVLELILLEIHKSFYQTFYGFDDE
jgi:replicative DNA helicase